MKYIIPVNPMGQITLPASIMQKMGILESGGVFRMRFDERNRALIISKDPKPTDRSNLAKNIPI
ncbi:MAG: hypothetical protein WCO52_04960 [bacterium]